MGINACIYLGRSNMYIIMYVIMCVCNVCMEGRKGGRKERRNDGK